MIERGEKVVWSEGMFLQPHHFQQQDRHVAAQIAATIRATSMHGWGFTELDIDQGELACGRIRLTRCAGVMRDGTPFDLRDDIASVACAIPEGARETDIVLALPLRRRGAVETQADPSPASLARFAVFEADVADSHYHGGDPATLQLARPHLSLMPAGEAVQGHTWMGVVRVLCRDEAGVVQLDPHFIPPVLGWRVSGRLATMLHSFLTQLRQRVHGLYEGLRRPGVGGFTEVQQFLLAQVLGRAEAWLAHVTGQQLMHPERIYEGLVALRGELAVFERGRGMPSLPPYRHDGLASCFAPLMGELGRAIAVAVADNVIALPIEERTFGLYHAPVADASLYANARFVLGVSSSLPVDRLLRTLPEALKVGPSERMRDLVDLQLPGLPVQALPGVPPELPAYPGFSYFEFDRGHPQWVGFAGSAGIGMHVSGDLPAPRFALWAIRGES
ncbi:type VI secretion system protein ImpJ [Luteibacter sp. Sphag1AF]|uniref:type VI secretion system baseplate subunit TssK n=1 Tax=Luteibacter sp. Sphag1AF TaxID=2587031 RepID=UPI001619577A|nr:type VI secretion system baseplate subunit TssK [Luteibacter sp. Sphag1AF]MBB3226948.1 type VI secretion system protein ImpJ [Luteibacter sp. Sphag1AF]